MRSKSSVWLIKILIVFSFFCCCDTDYHYNNIKDLFPSKFVDHFPDKIKAGTYGYVLDTTTLYDHVRLTLKVKISKDSIDAFIAHLEKLSLKKYEASDSCLLVVNQYTNKSNWFDAFKAYRDEIMFTKCQRNNYPVPNFWNEEILQSEKNLCKLPDEYNLYLIEAKSGIHWNQKYCTDGLYMPNEWRNGFSRGVAFDATNAIALYWFIIW